MAKNEYKIVLIGDGGVGKTSYSHRLLSGEFENKHIPTLGVEVHPLKLYTSQGSILFYMWDCAGIERFGGLRDGYYLQANACIVMFDVTDPASYERVSE